MKRAALALALAACTDRDPLASPAQLGKALFSDPTLSTPAGQSCADCHAPALAFRDPESDHTSSMGVVPGRFAARNAPSLLYARYIPPLRFDAAAGTWSGGLFWDGHADTLEAQAAGPLLNPLEMNNPSKHAVVESVRRGPNATKFREVFGPDALDDDDLAFAHIAEALAAYERSPELAPFSSRYDRYVAGKVSLTAQELRGLAIFQDPARGNCATCHPPPLFTTFGYANLGIPRYANNPFYGMPRSLNPDGDRHVDHGLAETTKAPATDGLFRIPTLRDVTRTAPYAHNGYFENVPFMLDFVASRDVGSRDIETCSRLPGARCPWPPAERPANLDPRVGHHALDDDELADLAAFLGTLDDAR